MLLYLAVGVMCVFAIACIVVIAWLLDDRKAYREREKWVREVQAASRDWYQSPFKGHPHIRANRDREVV